MTDQHNNVSHNSSSTSWPDMAWDIWCTVSLLGIWPRFIEPHLLFTSHIPVSIPLLPTPFSEFRIAFFSDLHLNQHLSWHFIQRLIKKIRAMQPHLILFGGDALCYGQLQQESLLEQFFSSLSAPYGCWASLGNHDYLQYTTESSRGEAYVYDTPPTSILWGLKKLFHLSLGTKTPRTAPIKFNQTLLSLYQKCGVEVLHNRCIQLSSEGQHLNLLGLGDLTAGHCDPLAAYREWDHRSPGIVLGHNPNAFSTLSSSPGSLFLFGHTHGGQVNLPFFSKRLVYLKNPKFKSGKHLLNSTQTAYITRGVGSCYPFRWFAPPEVVLFTLHRSTHVANSSPALKERKLSSIDVQWATSRNYNCHDL